MIDIASKNSPGKGRGTCTFSILTYTICRERIPTGQFSSLLQYPFPDLVFLLQSCFFWCSFPVCGIPCCLQHWIVRYGSLWSINTIIAAIIGGMLHRRLRGFHNLMVVLLITAIFSGAIHWYLFSLLAVQSSLSALVVSCSLCYVLLSQNLKKPNPVIFAHLLSLGNTYGYHAMCWSKLRGIFNLSF